MGVDEKRDLSLEDLQLNRVEQAVPYHIAAFAEQFFCFVAIHHVSDRAGRVIV